MPFRLVLFLLCLTSLLFLSMPALAQPEIVPAEHPVYEFLLQQRVAGRLPAYRHEARPLARSQILAHLEALERSANGPALRFWLDEFERELTEPQNQIEQVVGDGGVHIPLGRDTEKFLYYYRSPNWRFAFQGNGAVEVRYVDAGDLSASSLAFVPEVILQGNYRNLVGFYSGTFNGQQIAGDSRVLRFDPTLESLYYIVRAAVPPGNYDRSSASLRTGNGTVYGELAYERLIVGSSFYDPVILGGVSDYFAFLRLGLNTRMVQYEFIHAALGDQSRQFFPEPGVNQAILIGPERYLALHRLTFQPMRRLSLAFTEVVVYGLRGPELAYLNPVNPLNTAEHALRDRDNTLFALEGTLRPFDRIEAYSTLLIDDLDFGTIGRHSYSNKWIWQVGAGATLFDGLLGWTEYTRASPFVYTHRFEYEGSSYNAYQHNGFALGHPIGPNADQWAAGVKLLLPFRVTAEGAIRYVRRGENYLDEEGQVVNIGGDLLVGQVPDNRTQTKFFLDGVVFKGPGGTLSMAWQPIREVYLSLYADVQAWDRDEAADEVFIRASLDVEL